MNDGSLTKMENQQVRPADQPPTIVGGFYKFVKDHLSIVNGVSMAGASIVTGLDLLSPKAGVAAIVVYAFTGLLVALLLAVAFFPVLFVRTAAQLGFIPLQVNPYPLWRKPAWQFSIALLTAVTGCGITSIAKASNGGYFADKYPEIRYLQVKLLSLEKSNSEIKIAVNEANAKLNVLVDNSQNPQKDLVSRGYAYNGSGLMTAIQQADKTAIGLFVKAGFKANSDSPIRSLMRGSHQWNPEIAVLLSAEMFTGKYDCQIDLEGLASPVGERLTAYKRLCDTKWALEIYEEGIKRMNNTSIYPVAQRESSWWKKKMAEETFIVAQLKR